MSKQLERQPVSHVDEVWINRDTPNNLMIINSVMLFDEVIDYERFRAICEHRLVGRYARFRQRVTRIGKNSDHYWETDPFFDIRSHIRHIALPAPGDTATLQTLIGELMSAAFDPAKPLWRFYLIENVNGGCAVFCRIHHGIGDGYALIRVLLSITDPDPSAEVDGVDEQDEEIKPQATTHALAPVKQNVANATYVAKNLAVAVVGQSLDKIKHPRDAFDLLLSAGILTAVGATILTKLLVIPRARRSVFRGDLGVAKRVTWSEQVDLDQVKTIGRAFGATVNDVLIAAVTGALRRYMLAHQDEVEQGDIRAMVPVNMRPLDVEPTPGNQFSLVYLSLPVGVADANERLFEVKRRMDLLKNSPEPLVVYQLLNLLGMMPGSLMREATDWFASKASCVLTNVPGPRQTLYFAGQPMRNIMFWVPQSGDIGLGISILSYDGKVGLGITVDEGLVPNPTTITAGFQEEFDELVALAALHGEIQPRQLEQARAD